MQKLCSFLFVILSIFSQVIGNQEDTFVSLPPPFSAITTSTTEANKIGYLKIERGHAIDTSTAIYLRLALDFFKKEGVRCIILDLDTPGGEVMAAIECSRLLHAIDQEEHIPVIAWVHDWAMSAGAMLAYSCRYIVASPLASMGAAEPILMKQDGGTETASEKVNSALRSEFANLARFYGRDPLLAEAMVDKEMTLVWRNGSVVSLRDPTEVRSSDELIVQKGKLLTLRSDEMVRYRVAEAKLEGNLLEAAPFSSIEKRELLLYTNWKVQFFAFLSHPAVASLLMMGLILGIYLEAQSPGLGFPAFLGLTCLALILLSNFAMKAFPVLELILLGAGVLLLLVEIFWLPGFGVAGISGIILLLAGLFTLTLPSIDQLSFSWDLALPLVLEKLVWFAGMLIVSLGMIILLMRLGHRRKWMDWMVLKESSPSQESLSLAPGTPGIAFSTLRPSGKVEIEEKIYDAITEGGFVEKGEGVLVVRTEGNKLVVKGRGHV